MSGLVNSWAQEFNRWEFISALPLLVGAFEASKNLSRPVFSTVWWGIEICYGLNRVLPNSHVEVLTPGTVFDDRVSTM